MAAREDAERRALEVEQDRRSDSDDSQEGGCSRSSDGSAGGQAAGARAGAVSNADAGQSPWNARFPSRAWDSEPGAWRVLQELCDADAAVLEQLAALQAELGPQRMSVSIAKVRPSLRHRALAAISRLPCAP